MEVWGRKAQSLGKLCKQFTGGGFAFSHAETPRIEVWKYKIMLNCKVWILAKGANSSYEKEKEELLRTAASMAMSVINCFLFTSSFQGFTFPCTLKSGHKKTRVCLKSEKYNICFDFQWFHTTLGLIFLPVCISSHFFSHFFSLIFSAIVLNVTFAEVKWLKCYFNQTS